MLEEFYKYKIDYKDYIIMIKVGKFYEIIDQDALIINKIFKYKLSKLSDNLKCGFPVNTLDKVLDVLKEQRLNYLVIEDGTAILEEKFEDNCYDSYNVDINIIKYNLIKINKITKYLNDNVYDNISELLEEIESLINGRR